MKEISLDNAYKRFEHHKWTMYIEKLFWNSKLRKRGFGKKHKQEFVNFGYFCDWLKQEGYAIV